MLKYLGMTIVFCALTHCASAGQSSKEINPKQTGLTKGSKAPDFKGINAQTGSSLSLSKELGQGKYVWVLIWRLWSCGVCRQQLSEAQLYYPDIKKLGGEIIAISSHTPEQGKQVAKELGVEFPMLSDPKFEIIERYQVHNPEDDLARPASFVVNPRGEIIFAHVSMTISGRPPAKEIRDIFKSFLGAGPTL